MIILLTPEHTKRGWYIVIYYRLILQWHADIHLLVHVAVCRAKWVGGYGPSGPGEFREMLACSNDTG